MEKKNRKRQNHHVVIMASGTFLVSLLVFSASEIIFDSVAFILGVMLLIFIIITGIFFDVIGVAVTAASEASLHPKAAKKIFGAKEAVSLKRNAPKVSAFCNDVVGDISGTLSGAIGAILAIQLLTNYPSLSKISLGAIIAGIIAALTVGGKAAMKNYAMVNSVKIVFNTGVIIAFIKKLVIPEFLKRKR